MSEMKLTPQLIDAVQNVVREHDPEIRDTGLVAQYLSAVIGAMLGNADMPSESKGEILQQLFAFAKQVTDDIDAQRRQAAPPPQEAFGIWRPGQE